MATNTKTTDKAADKPEKTTLNAKTALRKGALAYIGLYGAAYERAQMRVAQARQATDGLFDTLVEKGEEMETQAGGFFKASQKRAAKSLETSSKKVRAILPSFANDRVEELEAEISALNKKIVAMSKKARPAAKADKAA
jgi:polyhydroxyalkanoate synthesis regulator phasin